MTIPFSRRVHTTHPPRPVYALTPSDGYDVPALEFTVYIQHIIRRLFPFSRFLAAAEQQQG
jgi:hypothetical protein